VLQDADDSIVDLLMTLKGRYTQKFKFCHQLLTLMLSLTIRLLFILHK